MLRPSYKLIAQVHVTIELKESGFPFFRDLANTMLRGSGSDGVKLQLLLRAQKLPNVERLFKKSDPYAIVTVLPSNAKTQPVSLGKTETIRNNLSPLWIKAFDLHYSINKPKYVNILIMDENSKREDKKMVAVNFDIGEVLGSPGNILGKRLMRGGAVIAAVVKASEQDMGKLFVSLRGKGLTNVEEYFGISDPYYEISAMFSDPQRGIWWRPVFRSRAIKNNLNPVWDLACADMNLLCKGDLNVPIKISVFDYESKGKHKIIGEVEISTNRLLSASGEKQNFDIRKTGKKTGQIYVTSAFIESSESMDAVDGSVRNRSLESNIGTEVLSTCKDLDKKENFVDYISGGCNLNLCVAIDFTASNGDPRTPGSPHYIDPSGDLNEYEKALTAIGSIISKYDLEKTFPVWGFGAKFEGIVRHLFQIGQSSEVQGVAGALEAYRQVFQMPLVMSNPSDFNAVITAAGKKARINEENAARMGCQSYTVLLLLTAGSVSDVNATKEVINAQSSAPLSIVIVGVGSTNFRQMQFLDDFASHTYQRDITQFVEFRKHQNSKSSLIEATLEEIPNQLVDYFNRNNIKPLSAQVASTSRDRGINQRDDEADHEIDLFADDDFFIDQSEDEDYNFQINVADNGEVQIVGIDAGKHYDGNSYGFAADFMK